MTTITQETLDTLLVCSVRYALGRMTYIVSEVCGIVRVYAERMSPNQRSVLLRDVRERKRPCGHACDESEWTALEVWLLSIVAEEDRL